MTAASTASDVDTRENPETGVSLDGAPHEAGFGSLSREALRLLVPYWPLAALASAMGVVAGLTTARLLATLNTALHAERADLLRVLLVFGALCALVLLGETVASAGNSIVGQRVIAALRKEVTARIATAPIAALQQHEAHRILATLSHDVDTISAFTFNVSGLLVSSAVTLGCLGYLAVLSPALFLATAVAIGLGLFANYLAGRTWMASYEKVRDAQDELQRGFEAITEGAKELRMNRARRRRVWAGQIGTAIDGIRDHKITAMRAFWASRALAGFLFFGVLGAIVALGVALGIDRGTLTGFALVLLYVKGPLESVVADLPGIGQAQIAFGRVARMSARFASPEPHLLLDGRAPGSRAAVARFAPGLLELHDVTYAYAPAARGTSGFTLGPLDLSVGPGETLFIVGENGCGKTTLLMLLLGLYAPTTGSLRLDGADVRAEMRDAYRQLFSTVFFDYKLFADIVVADDASRTERDARRRQGEHYLARLDLAEKVSIVDDVEGLRFSTIDLSAGQRKRLALVQAYLEERPYVVFDEWAAEQDPGFRRIFYTEILPDLKRQGKTLIVISHDDRYFDVADRRLTLRAGKVVEDVRTAPSTTRPARDQASST